MILSKTKLKIYNGKFFLIIEVFKTWQYYLQNYKYKFFIFISYMLIAYSKEIVS